MGQTITKTFNGNTPQTNDHPLARFTQFTDLYDSILWDEKTVRKMIMGGVLAPIVKGSETKSEIPMCEECPICFLYNNQMNFTTCCKQTVCTECYLQVRPPSKTTPCPFCNSQKFGAHARVDNPSVIQVGKENSSINRASHATQKVATNPIQKMSSPKPIAKTPDKQKINSSSSSHSPPMSSSSERRKLEDSMRKQRASSQDQLFDRHADPSRRNTLSWDERGRGGGFNNRDAFSRGRRQSSHNTQHHHRMSGGSSSMRQMEEMMLSEAIHASLLETETRTSETSSRLTSSSASPDLVPPTDDSASRSRLDSTSLDDEDELLRLAIAMSLQPSPAQTSPPSDQDPIVEDEVNLEEPTVMVEGGVAGGGGGRETETPDSPPLQSNPSVNIWEKLLESGFPDRKARIVMSKVEPQLIELWNMGFTDLALNVGLLERYQGRLLRVVNALSDREANNPSVETHLSNQHHPPESTPQQDVPMTPQQDRTPRESNHVPPPSSHLPSPQAAEAQSRIDEIMQSEDQPPLNQKPSTSPNSTTEMGLKESLNEIRSQDSQSEHVLAVDVDSIDLTMLLDDEEDETLVFEPSSEPTF